MSSVRADGSVDFNKFHKEQNKTTKFNLSNGKTGFQELHDGLAKISDKGQAPALQYLQEQGRASYFLGKNPKKVDASRQASKKTLASMTDTDQKQIKNMTQGMSAADVNLLGQSADKKLFERKQNTLSNGMTSSQYLKKTLAPLSDDGKLVMSKFYRDEGRASYYAHKGNDLKKESYFNNAQHQLNNLGFDDTQKVPTQELTNKLSDKDWQKVGFRANRYVQHRENGWKQAQFLYQAMGRESYFENRNNDKRAKAYHDQATKEYNAMTPDTQKRAMSTYDKNNAADLSKKANLWITKHYGRRNRRSGYNSYGHRYGRYGHHYQNNRGYSRNYSRSHSQKTFLHNVMGNKNQNYQHTQHHEMSNSNQSMSINQHEKKQPKRDTKRNKEVSFEKKQGGITPSDMPF